MAQWARRLEITTNIAILSFSLAVGGLLARNYFQPKPQQRPERKALVGTKLRMPDVVWNSSAKTVVLAISTQCHFCSDSIPFYQKLTQLAAGKHTRIVGVLPQPEEESKRYLTGNRIAVAEVHRLSLGAVGIEGTPTVLIVDSEGRVTREWVGKLDAEGEKQVLSAL